MAILLVSLRADRPGHVAGEVVTVLADLSKVGTLDRQDALVLDVPLTEAQATSLYLRNGVPQDKLDAEAAALAAWSADPANTALRDAYKTALDAASPTLYPARKRILDVTKVPQQTRNRIAAKWAKVAEKRAEADAEGVRRFLAFLRNKFGTLTAEEEARPLLVWLELLARRWAEAKAAGADERVLGRIDAIADRIRAEARAGERAILDPELALLPNAAVLTLTATQLSNATVTQ